MASLKELRNRISSISSTMQITSAMKMVSAAKLKKAQDAIQDLRPYADKLREILGNISGSIEQTEGSFTEVREVKKVLFGAHYFEQRFVRCIQRKHHQTWKPGHFRASGTGP